MTEDQANEAHATFLAVQDLQQRVGVLEQRWNQDAANQAQAVFSTTDRQAQVWTEDLANTLRKAAT